jgi:hypothetical protein
VDPLTTIHEAPIQILDRLDGMRKAGSLLQILITPVVEAITGSSSNDNFVLFVITDDRIVARERNVACVIWRLLKTLKAPLIAVSCGKANTVRLAQFAIEKVALT